MSSPQLDLGTATLPQLQEFMRRDPLLILPIGSVEQHGPHLPLLTDSIVAEELARRVRTTWPVVIAPTFVYAMASAPRSGGGRHFPGSIGMPAGTLVPALTRTLSEFLRSGFNRVLVMNGHMENVPAVYEAAENLLGVGGSWLAQPGERRIVHINWWDFVTDDHLRRFLGAQTVDWGAEHAGVLETSVLEALRPDLVDASAKVAGGAPDPVLYDAFPPRPETLWPNGIGSTALGSSIEMGQALVDITLDAVESIIATEFGEPTSS